MARRWEHVAGMQSLEQTLIAYDQIDRIGNIGLTANAGESWLKLPNLNVEEVIAIEEKSQEPSETNGHFEVYKLTTIQEAGKTIVAVQFITMAKPQEKGGQKGATQSEHEDGLRQAIANGRPPTRLRCVVDQLELIVQLAHEQTIGKGEQTLHQFAGEHHH